MQALMWNRDDEMAQHKRFTSHTDVQMYVYDPRSAWQRETNEHTYRLLRQDPSDGTDLSTYTQADRNNIARQFNTRPRTTLPFMTPINKLAESLH